MEVSRASSSAPLHQPYIFVSNIIKHFFNI